MNRFSESSQVALSTCHSQLRELFKKVLKYYDCFIIEGYRTKERQQELFSHGNSKVKFSKHNIYPSHAVDVAPFPIQWDNTQRFHDFAKLVLTIAKEQNIKIRWGGDWDMDGDTQDQSFNDLVHFELCGEL